jgi:hypothetical protein
MCGGHPSETAELPPRLGKAWRWERAFGFERDGYEHSAASGLFGKSMAMANVRHAAKLREGAQGWNIWRAENPGVTPDLSDLKLPAGARRFGPDEGGPIDLSRANLRRTALACADLLKARLDNADLSGADLSGANLAQVDLTGAQLAGTDLSGAWLGDARGLTQAQVNRAKGDRTTVLPEGLMVPPGWLGETDAPAPEPAGLGAEHEDSGHDTDPDTTAEGEAGKGANGTDRDDKSGKGSDAESDPYRVLGVGRKASQTEIRAAYLRLVKELHPDGRTPGADADDDIERLKVINDAYQTLKGADRQAVARQAERRRRGAAAFMAGVVTAMVPLVVAALFAARWLGPPRPTTTAAVTDPASRMPSDNAPDRTRGGAGDGTAGNAEEAVQTTAISVHVKETDGGRGRALMAARRRGTREAWEQLALAYPDGETAAEAKTSIAAIERAEARQRQEAIDWARVENSGDKKELERFVLAHPESARAVQARETIAAIGLAGVRLREAIAWAEAQKIDSPQELERFARTHPHSVHAPQARRRVAVLEAERRRDAADWEKALRLHSRAGYAGYVSRNPRGDHVTDANRRMAELARAESRPTVEPVKAVAEAPAVRQRAPEASQGWPAADEPFVGADGRIRR